MSNSTLEFYDKNAEQYKFATQKLDFTAIYEPFLDQLSSGAFILDFGCGAGRDTKYFLENGYQVEAIDGSVEMCKIACAYTGIEVKQMLFDDLTAKEKYMGIWACASVLHLEKKKLKIVMKKMCTALKEGGVVYLSFKYGDFYGERDGRYFTDYTEKLFSILIWEIGGFSILDLWQTDGLRLDQRKERWLNIILKKRKGYDEFIGRTLDEQKLNLTRKGVDFWDDSYSKHPEFVKLKHKYTYIKNRSVRTDLLVEQSLGQKHLEKIYGPYSLKIMRTLTKDEALVKSFYEYIKIKQKYDRWEEKDVWRVFWRKDLNNAGLCIRLREWGLDVNAFGNNTEKFRLLNFLLFYEYANQITLKKFWENPTMENVDQSRIGHKTKNGEIMNDFKENISIMIEGDYVAEVKQTLYNIGKRWENVIRYVLQIRKDFSSNPEAVANELEQLYERIANFTKAVEFELVEDIEDSLYKQFYLKLCTHEMIGRENDIIDVIKKVLDYDIKGEQIIPRKDTVWISRNDIKRYCENNRKEFAQLFFGKEKLNSNDYKKLDKAIKKVSQGLNFFWDETEFRRVDKIPDYLLIISIQEYLAGEIKSTIDNRFYRYLTSEQKTMSAELKTDKPFDKSKITWIERVKKRISAWNVPIDIYIWEKKIELQIEKIIIAILNSNSIEMMKNKNERYLAIINWQAVSLERLKSVIDFIGKETGFQFEHIDSLYVRTFLGFLWSSEEVLHAWTAKFKKDLEKYRGISIIMPLDDYLLEYFDDEGKFYRCGVQLILNTYNCTIGVMDLRVLCGQRDA